MSGGVFSRQQLRVLIAAGVFLMGAVVSTLLPLYASADTVTSRSITLSSSATKAQQVTYGVNFTPAQDAGAFVVDFCSNSPVIGDSCTDPTSDGFNVTSAASTTPNFTDVTGSGHQVIVAGTMTAATPVAGTNGVEISGITNPSTAGPLYARIVTFDTKTDAQAYASEGDVQASTGYVDSGAVALSITDSAHISGQVLETMTFCVSGANTDDSNPITASCGSGIKAPTLKLGETSGTTTALSANAVSSGSLWTQLSTNAASGAVINLKSSAVGCGGLKRAGDANACDIKPVLDTNGITKGQALFGVKVGAPAATTGYLNPAGTLEAVSGSVYNTSKYALNYVTGNATGVTSTYGDPFIDSAGAPVDNQNMQLTFGASIANDTPAGSYSTDLSLIATGKF